MPWIPDSKSHTYWIKADWRVYKLPSKSTNHKSKKLLQKWTSWNFSFSSLWSLASQLQFNRTEHDISYRRLITSATLDSTAGDIQSVDKSWNYLLLFASNSKQTIYHKYMFLPNQRLCISMFRFAVKILDLSINYCQQLKKNSRTIACNYCVLLQHTAIVNLTVKGLKREKTRISAVHCT